MAISIDTDLRNLLAGVIATEFEAATLNVYDGAPPSSAQDPVGAQTLLASVVLPASSFTAAANGAVAKNGVWDDQSIDASGTAAWFRLVSATAVIQGTITATSGGGDMEVDDVNFVAGGVFTVTAFSVTMPAA